MLIEMQLFAKQMSYSSSAIASVVFEKSLPFFLTAVTDSDIDWGEYYSPCSSSSSSIYIHIISTAHLFKF